MVPPRRRTLAFLGLMIVTGLVPLARGDEPAKTSRAEPTPDLLATQVMVTFDRVVGPRRERRRFQATVVGKTDDSLTAITAAHCAAASDVGTAAILKLDGAFAEAKITGVVRNPSYQGEVFNEVPGPDNAVLRLHVLGWRGRPALETLKGVKVAPGLASNPVPRPTGQTVTVHMIDARGVEHEVRAGNYANPRWLEWGAAYRPIPGDSGGGVFLLVPDPAQKATPRPVLIGVISVQDEKGGGASLVSLKQEWLAKELP